jgi:hypothetical protein
MFAAFCELEALALAELPEADEPDEPVAVAVAAVALDFMEDTGVGVPEIATDCEDCLPRVSILSKERDFPQFAL